MKLTPPKKNVFWITVIIAVVAVAAYVVPQIVSAVPGFVSMIGAALLAVAYILLVLSIALKGF
ncbi:MAG: hypothetical protein JXN65_05225 [Clostridia bacterium]|nr:hypothetical protein [Clostridia bacterium]